jgi:hypothetical protein
MKHFKDYLSESVANKKYNFRVKVAGDFDGEQETLLKSILEKFQVDGFKKISVTPIQEFPLDFPQVKNCEVSIFEVTLDYPTTPFELKEYISSNLKINQSHLAVVNPNEPSEEYQRQEQKREGALLTDSEYKEAPNANFDDYYGSKYNSGFVKELNDILKLQRKERGEIIPETAAAIFNTDTDEDSKSVLIPNKDPRK